MPPGANGQVFAFGPFEFDARLGLLYRGEEEIYIPPRAAGVLQCLLERPGEVVSKQALVDAVWADSYVSDTSLSEAVGVLRQAIGDDPQNPTYIRTVHRRGYQFIGEVRRDAGEVEASAPKAAGSPEELPGEPTAEFATPEGGKISSLRASVWRQAVPWVISAGIAVAICVVFWPSGDRPVMQSPETIPLTAYPGAETDPAISPNGNHVAFVRRGESGIRELYVLQIRGGEPVRVSSGDQHARGPTWSPRGQRLAFLRRVEGEDGGDVLGVFIMPYLGGREELLATSRGGPGSNLDWSPTGEWLAFTDRDSADGPTSIYLLSLETREKVRLTTPPADHLVGDSQPRFSPDGESVAFVRERVKLQSDVHLVSISGNGEPIRLTTNNHITRGLDWTHDGQSVVFSANRLGREGFFSLWRVSIHGGEPDPLPLGGQGVSPTLSQQGGRMSYAKLDEVMDIWRIDGPAATDSQEPATRLISSTRYDYFPAYSPDGEKIAFVSQRSGSQEIWVSGRDGSNAKRLTFLEDMHTMDPSWSPDGQRIAFWSSAGGNYDIYVVAAAGGNPDQLTRDTSEEIAPNWSRDGRWVYFYSNRTGRRELFRVPAEGGDAAQLTTNGGTEAYESLDGRFIYFVKSHGDGGPRGIWRIPAGGGEELKVHERGEVFLWAVLKNHICYLDRDTNPPAIHLLELATGEIRRLAEVERTGLLGFSVSPDERHILYAPWQRNFDIMLVENLR
jgi:Tol biopolymer transport system component/DNA-binding winged helix-turn-helix (wHTH) protein